MIRRTLIVIIISSIFAAGAALFPATRARADEVKFAMVVSDDAAFYADAGCEIIKFYLPKSYFVKVVSAYGDVSRVIYMDDGSDYPMREGYVKTVDLDFSFASPSAPYPSVTLTACSDEVLFSGTDKSQPKTVIASGSHATYYGSITVSGEKLLYVYANGFIGYVRESGFAPYEVGLHPLYDSLFAPAESSSAVGDSSSESVGGAGKLNVPYTAIIFGVIIVFALLLMFFILKPDASKASSNSFFGDDD